MTLKVYVDRMSQPSRAVILFCKLNKIEFEEYRIDLAKHHWYPADLSKKAKIHSVLDWHHSNLRRGAAPYVLHTTLAPALGLKLNPRAAAEAEKILDASLSTIENVWLKGSGKFLLGSHQPSVADLSLLSEIMQLELLGDTERDRVLGPYKKVQQWIEAMKNATQPHFKDVHAILFRAKERFRKMKGNGKYELRSKI